MKPNPIIDNKPKRYVGRGLLIQKPSALKHPKKNKVMNPNIRISLFSVQFQFTAPIPLFFPRWLFFLEKYKIFNN